jgi:hypothetical protein
MVAAIPLLVVRAAVAPSASATAMASAANAFLTALTSEQRQLAAHAFDGPTRQQFHFVPMERTGLPLKRMTPEQRALAHALLRTGLSQAGYDKITQIIELEKVLAEIEKNPVRRDPENYYFWVFGTPAAQGTWAWKAEGHHISLNFTVVKGTAFATTPQFLGANPAELRAGPQKGKRLLGAEEDVARELVSSFDAKTRSEVIFDAKALPEVLSYNTAKVDPLPPAGLPASRMSAAQKEILRRLLATYAGAMPAPLAAERLARAEKAGLEAIRFAWAGGTKRGEPHYYRVQGPTFLVEFDNTQNGGNHAHSVWRDFEGDFGRDLLREHLRAAHDAGRTGRSDGAQPPAGKPPQP